MTEPKNQRISSPKEVQARAAQAPTSNSTHALKCVQVAFQSWDGKGDLKVPTGNSKWTARDIAYIESQLDAAGWSVRFYTDELRGMWYNPKCCALIITRKGFHLPEQED